MGASASVLGDLVLGTRLVLSRIGGVFLLVMGTAMVTDLLFTLNTWLIQIVPIRPRI